MKTKLGVTCILIGSLLSPIALVHAEGDVDRDHPMTFVKDSAITSAIKAKLAVEHFKSLKNIKVDTDDKGVVWLGGFASSQEQVEKAEAIARHTDGVRVVKNHIIVQADN